MRKGQRVRVVKLKSERGVTWSSLRAEMEGRNIGRVETQDDNLEHIYTVKFPGCEGPMQVPRELLEAVR